MTEEAKHKEMQLYMMHLHLAHAHRNLALGWKDLAEAEFDKAEELGREAFNAESIHVARFTEDAQPYKLALGSILSAGKSQYVRLNLIEVLCRIHEIDPDEMRKLYTDWQEGKEH